MMQFRSTRPVLIATASAVALLSAAGGAHAQAGNASDPDAVDIGEIVVTAQKRSERLIDVPASVTALSPEVLLSGGALRFEDYQAFVPGLTTTGSAPGYNQINIRGVTTGINQLSSTVSTYFDEAPTNSSTAAAVGNRITPDPDLFDVERIEVLRGPQGTLYGANALGGVLKYVLAAPSLDITRARVQVGGTSVAHGDNGLLARGVISTPIIEDRLGVRLSGFYNDDPGFIDNIARGEKDVNRSVNSGARLAVLWRPSDTVSVTASSLYQHRDTQGTQQESVDTTDFAPTYGRYVQSSPTAERIDTRYQLHALTVTADLGFADLTSATSYGRQKSDLALDYSPNFGTLLDMIGLPGLPNVSVPVANDVKKFTQEVRLSSPTGGAFEYVVGAYYTREKSASINGAIAYTAAGIPAPAPVNPLQDVDLRNSYKETAVFANGVFNLSDRFSIGAGGRWSRNEQESTEPLLGLLFGPLAGTVISQESSEEAWTWAVSPKFEISDNVNVYARVAKGFRPGGANLVLPGGGAPTYDSDTLINYEAGVKGAFLDRRLSVSVAAFRIDWDDIQTTAKDSVGFNYLVNGGEARSTGFEGEGRWISGGLTLGGNLTYVDTEIRNAIAAVGAAAGDDLPYSPKWAGALTLDQEFAVSGDVTVSVGATLRYVGSRQAYYSQATAGNPGGIELDAYTMGDLRASVRWDRYDLTASVQNVTDEYAQVAILTEIANPVTGLDARASVARPRTFGLTLSAAF